jgi:hypothetical protein
MFPRATALRRLLLAGMVAVAAVVAGCASGGQVRPAPPPPMPAVASGRFCAVAQQRMSSTHLEAVNVVHADYDTFVKSKPQVRPLETEEFHWNDEPAARGLRMVSCKMKTVDHLKAEYGPDSAGEEGSCAGLNAATLETVLAGLGPSERRRLRFDHGRAVRFDPDVITNDGPLWLAPFALASLSADGSLHIASKAMRNDWNDPRLKDAPVRFKGTRYCHLIAPDYLKRLLLGEESVPAP